ncbi:hypothetical protein LVJ94_18045 [Pendulispora rubella]|uniref:Secreted protein n=1 Tax=Pendulispora rubella TaxID=2741070 RepID=A0ABZ2LDW2_9BACT
MHLTLILVAASLLLSACTHDYDVFKPKRDAGPDASSSASNLDTEAVEGEEED